MKTSAKPRRQFLKNLSLASLSIGLAPAAAKGQSGPGSANSRECFTTTPDYFGEGPFYTPDAPYMENHMLAGPEEPGDRLILSGQVRNLDCSELIQNTVIDVWHANDAGQYDNAGYNLRGGV